MEPKLCFVFWFLLLLHHQGPSMSTPFPKSGCRTVTKKQCNSLDFVPGHTLLGEGINIVTMEKTDSSLLDLEEVGEECTVCDNPYENNAPQKLPKAMVDWRAETSCTRDIQSSVFQSVVSVAEEVTSVVQNDWKVGLNVNYKVKARIALGGSQSKMVKFAYSKSIKDSYSFLSHKLECSFYSFRLGLNDSLTPHFKSALEELPDFYNKAKYRRLIESFGTHYITHVKAGGWTQDITAVRTCEVAMSGLNMDEVKDCLALEAEIGISKTSASSKLEHCKNKSKESGFKGDFHQAFGERMSKVIGGNAVFDLLSPDLTTPEVFDKWMESLKTHPDLVSYSLDPIHNLVKLKGSRNKYLMEAISDYIKEKALTQKCSCPGGQVIRHGDDCSCTCKASRYTGADCCTTHRGAARLSVNIKSAKGLSGGKIGSEAGGYVIFKFGNATTKSSVVKNKKNPTWNVKYDMGFVDLNPSKHYTIEVWDSDSNADNFLGRCEKPLASGNSYQTCHLNKGFLTYSLSVTCADRLGGPFCLDYIPILPVYSEPIDKCAL